MKKFVIPFIIAIVCNILTCLTAKAGFIISCETPPDPSYHTENPTTAYLSDFALFNATMEKTPQKDNVALPNDGAKSLLYCYSTGAMNDQHETIVLLTEKQDKKGLEVHTNILNKKEFYQNKLCAKTTTCFNPFVRADFNKIDVQTIENGENGGTYDFVTLSSEVSYQVSWVNSMTKKPIIWNSQKKPGFIGQVDVSMSYAPNGSEVFHLHMEKNVVMSIVRMTDLDKNGLGEWLPDSIKTAGKIEKKIVHLPSVEMESKINLNDFTQLDFLFNECLFFGNCENAKVEAFVHSKFTLNERGVNNKSKAFIKVSKKAQTPDIVFDSPFVGVLSVVENGQIMPFMTVRIVKP